MSDLRALILARLDEQLALCEAAYKGPWIILSWPAAIRALRLEVEQHKSNYDPAWCSECHRRTPCSTIVSTAKELGVSTDAC